MPAVLTGVGAALPDRVVGNEHFADVGITDEWIVQRTGIRERRWLGAGESLTDLAVRACAAAVADAGLDATEIDLVLAATVTADRISPGLAPFVAHALGVPRPGAVDLNSACAGFLYALHYAVAAVSSGANRCVLVCGAEAVSRISDPTDQQTAALFGDGAGAVVVRADDRTCPQGCAPAVRVGSDGALADILGVPRTDPPVIRMDGREVYEHAVAEMVATLSDVCADRGLAPADIDLLVPHQANIRIIKRVAGELGVPTAKAAVYIAELGNTSASSIPIALSRARADGRLEAGTRVAMAGFGAGLSWGGALVDWGGCRHVLAGASR